MTYRIMYDAVTVANLPKDGDLYAGYVNGDWPNAAAIQKRFPKARVVTIAVTAAVAADVLDVESGDATPAEAPEWVTARRREGRDPTVYCNSSTWPAVRAAFDAAGTEQPHWWIAKYDEDPTIPSGASAKQHTNTPGYDISSVAPYWPGIDPKPLEDDVTPADIEAIANAVYKKIMHGDGDLAAPEDAADRKLNPHWQFSSHVTSTDDAARAARTLGEQAVQHLVAIRKKLGI